jgi:hypothetical protein
VRCPPGTYCRLGILYDCPVDTYSPLYELYERTGCLRCPVYSSSPPRSTSKEQCRCNLRYMKIGENESLACQKCPVGANCSTIGVTLRELPLFPGYWRWRRDVADVKRCPGYSHGSANTTGCAGHVTGAGEDEFGNDYCKQKLVGPYCSVCDPELALVSGTPHYYNSANYACEVCTATYEDLTRVVS